MRDKRWFIVFLIILLVILIASIMNYQNDVTTTNRVENTIDVDNEDLKINWNNYPTNNIRLKSSIDITKSGIYHLKGIMYDGMISVKPDDDAVVKLILDNVIITNSNGPAIACYAGNNIVIELVGQNTLKDGSSYASNIDEDVTGTIYSKADLTFQGDGQLTLAGNNADGIVSKDDLTFRGGTYNITAQDDGIRGKDSVHIAKGDFIINSSADAIKSTNEDKSNKGFIFIEDGSFNLNTNAKGIKAINSILIHDGNYAIATNDDSIHSDNFISISGGNISINAGDDGIHANRELEITGGTINIAKSYEGLEAQKVTIAGGDISVTATDDGINAGGGTDNSATNRPNQSPFNADEKCILSINDGNLYINASGDGLDSNGWLYFNGGKTIIDGPTDENNGALDAGMGIVINGGEVIALGSSGMAGNLGQTSTINSLNIFLSKTYPKKTEIKVYNDNGDVIISHTSTKAFSHLAIGTPSLTLGETYTLYLDDEPYANITISGIVTTFGSGNSRPSINQPL